MLNVLNKFTGWASSRKGAKIVLLGWLAVIVIVTAIAPTAKSYSISAGEGSIHEDTPSAIASRVMEEHFPSEDGLPALVVFHNADRIGEHNRKDIAAFSEWLASSDKPEHVGSALPFHLLSKSVQDAMLSSDQSTLVFPLSLKKGLDSDVIYDSIAEIRTWLAEHQSAPMEAEITGPAGIAADTLSLFKNADFILMFATVALILVILLIIYRSPLLALIPLVAAGLLYQVVDRIIGFAGKQGWFIIDSQALSIMMILLFAVVTDYCLFIFSRYREQLSEGSNKYDAMKAAVSHVGEPILFSGGTVLIAMLTLFAAIFKPYHHFAPVFSIAMVVILLGGLTLIPAIFALLGRKAFWPFVPKRQSKAAAGSPRGFWGSMASRIVKRPAWFAGILLVIMLAASASAATMNFSYNLMKSFPDDLSSRKGFELLEQNYPKGSLAPVTVIVASKQRIDDETMQSLTQLMAVIDEKGGVEYWSPSADELTARIDANAARGIISDDKLAMKLELTLSSNPYDQEALQTVKALIAQSDAMLKSSGLDPEQYTLHFAGQSAEQLDVSVMNMRDITVMFSLIIVLITLMLLFQTRSIPLSLLMMFTILLSYAATLGFGWFISQYMLGYDAISYRIPVYTFVFLVALGIDYNIMLVSRIREEQERFEWKEAVRRGLASTGAVISSAGVILAATFAVLITQPLQELFLFGMMMAIGVLLDTFVVRGMLLPSLMVLIGRKNDKRA